MTKTYLQKVLTDLNTHTLKMALYSSSSTIDSNTTVYSTTNEITANGYVAGGHTLAGGAVTVDGAGYALNFDSHTYENCNIVARKAMIYDVTDGNRAISVIDYGSEVGVVGSGTFVVDAVVRLA